MIKIYTLVNGEQIIGSHIQNYESVTIRDPFYIVESQDEYGNNGMRLINVCTFSEEQCINVNNNHIIFSLPASKNMIVYYEKLVNAHNRQSASKILADAIREMDDMEEKMLELISNRLVGGSTIN
jgi:hypothetical protein